MRSEHTYTKLKINAKNENNGVLKFCSSFSKQIILFLSVIIIWGCTEKEDTVSSPTVTSKQISEISYETATSGGHINSDGGNDIIAKGVCWSISNQPSIADSKTTDGTGTGNFTSSLAGLLPNTTYYLRAYASNSFGTSYGEEIEFTTIEAPVVHPTIISEAISEIGSTTATSGGNITSDGGSDIIARGVCWSVSNAPSITDSKTTDGIGMGSFTSSLTGLLPNTTYYLRAYASNSFGTSYGEEINFTTNEAPVVLPTITSTAVSEISSTTATSGGNITSDGGSGIITRGVCWSVSNAPSITDSKTTDGTGVGNFTSSLTELLPNTTYYLRAYASNSFGTSYGEEINFTTNAAPVVLPTITSTAVSEISSTTATSGGNITSDGGSGIITRGVCWSTSNAPSIADSKTTDGTGVGYFTSYLTGLLPNSTYYLRAYASNSVGTSYGEEISFTTGSNIYSGDVYLNNQQEVDDFGSMGYTTVTGDVVIEPSIPTTFSNLNGLSSLTSIGGSLIISKTIGLQNLLDLRNLSTVGDDIMLSYNQGLTSIGLESLSSVGRYFFINYNEDLIDLDGLTKLRSNGGNPDLSIWNNTKLESFCGIKPLLSDFTGVFSIMSNLYNPTQQDIVNGNCSQ